MKIDGTQVQVSSNAERYLENLPLEKIEHPGMDKQNPYRPFHTGIFQEKVTVDHTVIAFFSYVPRDFSPSGPMILIFTDDKTEIPEKWLNQTGWNTVAEKYQVMLCVLARNGTSWGEDEEQDYAYAKGVLLSTLDRCLYNTNESVYYVVGYGKGNRAALRLALMDSDKIAAFVACGVTDEQMPEMEILQESTVGEGEGVFCKEVNVHGWIIEERKGFASRLIHFLKRSNQVREEELYNPVAKVYRKDPARHFAAINEYPEAQLWVSEKDISDRLSCEELHEWMWLFLSRVKRWRGAPCGSIRPARTAENMRLHRYEEMIGGYRRYWHLFIPSRYEKHPEEKYPLVVCTHGYSCTGEIFAENSDWHLVGEARNFFVLYVTALPHTFCGNWVPLPMWNACYWKKEKYADDTAYIMRAIERVKQEFPILDSRVYAAGHSNGGAMCEELMFNNPHTFAAFSPAGYTVGDLEEKLPSLDKTERPILLHKSEFDLFSAADLSLDGKNMRLLSCICSANGADFAHPAVRVNGQYEHYTYLTAQGIPMVRLCIARNMNHTYTPELAWMTWDDFFCHFERAEDGKIRYIW